jgi:hypothetical protein
MMTSITPGRSTSKCLFSATFFCSEIPARPISSTTMLSHSKPHRRIFQLSLAPSSDVSEKVGVLKPEVGADEGAEAADWAAWDNVERTVMSGEGKRWNGRRRSRLASCGKQLDDLSGVACRGKSQTYTSKEFAHDERVGRLVREWVGGRDGMSQAIEQ